MIIPVFMMMLLAWVMKSEEPVVFPEKHSIKLTPYGVLASIALLFIPLYALIFILFRPQLGFLPPVALHKIPLATLAFIMGSGIVSLILLIAFSTYQRISHAIGIILWISSFAVGCY